MPGFPRHNDFAFSSTLINAFDPCSSVTRKRQWQLDSDCPEFVPVKRKRKHQSATLTSHDQEVPHAQRDSTVAMEKTVDYSYLLKELEPLAGQALFERLVTLPLPQVL